jgi:hypothetical protein
LARILLRHGSTFLDAGIDVLYRGHLGPALSDYLQKLTRLHHLGELWVWAAEMVEIRLLRQGRFTAEKRAGQPLSAVIQSVGFPGLETGVGPNTYVLITCEPLSNTLCSGNGSHRAPRRKRAVPLLFLRATTDVAPAEVKRSAARQPDVSSGG